MDFRVSLIPEEEGGFSVVVPGLPGCVSQGETREEAHENIKEAIALYLEAAQEMAAGGESALVHVDQSGAINSGSEPSPAQAGQGEGGN